MLNPALRVQWLSGIRMSTLQGLDLASQTILKTGNLLVYDIFQGKIHLEKLKKTFKNNLRKERISSAQNLMYYHHPTCTSSNGNTTENWNDAYGMAGLIMSNIKIFDQSINEN